MDGRKALCATAPVYAPVFPGDGADASARGSDSSDRAGPTPEEAREARCLDECVDIPFRAPRHRVSGSKGEGQRSA